MANHSRCRKQAREERKVVAQTEKTWSKVGRGPGDKTRNITMSAGERRLMDLRRVCIHEAGHFYLAFKYRPARAVSICISRQVQTDPPTGEEYVSLGQAVSFDPHDSLPKVQVSIRAAGLAAESLVYNEAFDALMGNPAVRFRIKTDTDNAKRDLAKAGLLFPSSSDAEFVFLFSMGFYDAVTMLRNSQDKLHCIADYCLANLDREISKAELVETCSL
jgi:hypothetical protein